MSTTRAMFDRALFQAFPGRMTHVCDQENSDALWSKLQGLLATVWDEGHRTPQRLGLDDCRCAAWSANECACGRYGSNVITPNPYRPATTHRPETTTDAREANPHG